MKFTIRARYVLAGMLGAIAVLTLLHLGQAIAFYVVGDVERFDGVRMFDFDYEKNVPSLYSSLAILFCAVILWCIAVAKRRVAADFHYHWLILAIIFTYIGIDEALALHEQVGDLFEDYGLVNAEGFLYFAWVVPYAVLVLIFAVSYLKFVLALPRPTMLFFMLSGGLFVTGAMGIEVFSAKEADLAGFDTITYLTLYTTEELCEMVGIALFCYALLRYVNTEYGDIYFDLRP